MVGVFPPLTSFIHWTVSVRLQSRHHTLIFPDDIQDIVKCIEQSYEFIRTQFSSIIIKGTNELHIFGPSMLNLSIMLIPNFVKICNIRSIRNNLSTLTCYDKVYIHTTLNTPLDPTCGITLSILLSCIMFCYVLHMVQSLRQQSWPSVYVVLCIFVSSSHFYFIEWSVFGLESPLFDFFFFVIWENTEEDTRKSITIFEICFEVTYSLWTH